MDYFDINATLTPNQVEQVLQFQKITTVLDPIVCHDVLQRHKWNLASAVKEQLNLNEGKPSVFATTTRPPRIVNDISGRIYHSASALSFTASLHIFLRSVLLFIYNFCLRYFQFLMIILMSVIGADVHGHNIKRAMRSTTKFIQYYNDIYTPIHPVFYQGDLSQVLIDAKRELKLLLVYLHNEDYVDTYTFCTETLANPSVVAYINRHFFFWASASKFVETHVLEMFSPRNYPFIAVVLLKSGRMTIVVRMEGFCTATSLMQRLASTVKDFQPYLDNARTNRIELNCSRP